MNNETTIPINVWLGGRSYRIRIKPNQEEIVRKAVKYADDKVAEFRNSYAGKDDQDFLAMVLLMYALDSVVDQEYDPYTKATLQSLTDKIDAVLSSAKPSPSK